MTQQFTIVDLLAAAVCQHEAGDLTAAEANGRQPAHRRNMLRHCSTAMRVNTIGILTPVLQYQMPQALCVLLAVSKKCRNGNF